MLRIVQEGLRNALRHAAAERIEVALTCDARQVTLHIADDGRGIAPDKLNAPHGGLEHIRMRARGTGGSAEVESDAGGTRWTVTLPLPVDPAATRV
jgi:signal transduction histidine kinase